MSNIAIKNEKYSSSWMDAVATKHANKVTEQKQSINWVEFWRMAYYEKLRELQTRSQIAG